MRAIDRNRELARNSSVHCSLNRLSFFFRKNLIEQREIVQTGEIGHLPAEKSSIKGLLRGAVSARHAADRR